MNSDRSETASDDFRFRLDQLVGIKDAARSLPRLIERDEAVVLTRRGTPAAVLVPLIEYTKLRNCQRLVERGIEKRYPSDDSPGNWDPK